MPSKEQNAQAAKWLKRIKKESSVVAKVKVIRAKSLEIRTLQAEIDKLAEEIDDHEPLSSQLPMVPLDQYVPMPRNWEMNGFKWWDYAPIELGDDSEAAFLKALSLAFATSEEGIVAERDRHR